MRNALLAFVLALAACGQDPAPATPEGGIDAPPPVKAADLCVSSDCGEAIAIVDIPDAENTLFTDDGRLFVSGGENVYEITRDSSGAYAATAISAEGCNFTGMAVREGYLYASCSDGFFFAGKLDPVVALKNIFTFDGMCIPNGTALGPDGRIYVVDEPLTCVQDADPKIVALTIDPKDPLKVTKQEVWIQGAPTGGLFLDLDTTFRFPNGLVRDGNTFYGTDGGSVYSVSISDTGVAGAVTPLFFEPTAHDDLALAGDDGLLVCDFFKGRIVLLDRAGTLLQETLPGTFVEPSSVRLGRPPLFAPTDILVTDKGVISEMDLPIDKLYVYRRTAP